MRTASLICTMTLLSWHATVSAADYVAMSGKELYLRFCSSCHGATGHGDGPVASSFKVEVPDLTLIALRAGGSYPRDRIERIIDGRYVIGAHGDRTMPVWGEDLNRLQLGNPDAERGTRLIIQRLADYVWLLQKPSTENPRRSDE
ncbi:c-type cytochrome [Steroidobacter cummioxidans]|uniref:c-type cytochrome n=1 Tax=Steroidobacter cummioxidans TaxID=1803913 RepID=UPI000E31D46D|nr:cytochrome c [Steroidobacter cummioxidans]